ncbi:hypothetical protein J6590_098588, partial [Homalodisca vitripennis]
RFTRNRNNYTSTTVRTSSGRRPFYSQPSRWSCIRRKTSGGHSNHHYALYDKVAVALSHTGRSVAQKRLFNAARYIVNLVKAAFVILKAKWYVSFQR